MNKVIDRVALMLVAVLVLTFSVSVIMNAFHATISFDGGMNIQVAQSLARSGRYETTYDHPVLFDHKVQTGAPVLLPIALSFKLFGEHAASALIVNSLYLILFMLVGLGFMRRHLKSWVPPLLLCVLWIAVPTLETTGFGIYGELPCMAFFMLTVLLYCRLEGNARPYTALLTGVCYGLAYLTKTVILVTLPFALVILALDVAVFKRVRAKDYGLIVLGAALPMVAFEAYRLAVLGWPGFRFWWHTSLDQILRQTGTTTIKGSSILRKVVGNILTYCSFFGLHPAALSALLILSFVTPIRAICYLWRKKTAQVSVSAIWVWTSAMSYLGWWFIISPESKAWSRRVLSGHLLLLLSCVIGACYLTTWAHARFAARARARTLKHDSFGAAVRLAWKTRSVVLMIPCLAFALLFGVAARQTVLLARVIPQKVADQRAGNAGIRDMASVIARLSPDARVYGYGWWQSPVLAFESGRMFLNTYRTPLPVDTELRDHYVVLDGSARAIALDGFQKLTEDWDITLYHESGANALYEVAYVPSCRAFSPEEYAAASSSAQISAEGTPGMDGVHGYERSNGARWATPDSAYLLRRNGERNLALEFFTHDPILYSDQQLTLNVYIGEVLAHTESILQSGMHTLTIPIPDTGSQTDVLRVRLVFNALYTLTRDERDLSALIKRVEFVQDSP